MNNIVIIGGGHAAAQLCSDLVETGQGARVHLVCEEPLVPYQRPPLSKTFLKGSDESPQLHRNEAWYREAGITVYLSNPAVAIDRVGHTVRLRSGVVLDWERLVLATGTRARTLPGLSGGLDNVAVLRSAGDAQSLRSRLAAAQHVTVLGGGFIGLEVAATARAMGKEVTVLESAPRLLGRAVSPALSAHVLQTHQATGIDIRLGVKTGPFETQGTRLASIGIDGALQPVDLMVLGIGAVPETALAAAAGLQCADGIVVDTYMRTSDPHILAVGDCTRFPNQRGGHALRLESVQNANDQARIAVATLAGTLRPYNALPWFWSDQGSLRLQMVGLLPAENSPELLSVRRSGASDVAFSLLHYAQGQLLCVESVNAPVDHMMSRKLIEAGRHPDPAAAADPAVPLKSHLERS